MTDAFDSDVYLAKLLGRGVVVLTALVAVFMAIAVLVDPAAINPVLGAGIADFVLCGLWLLVRRDARKRGRGGRNAQR